MSNESSDPERTDESVKAGTDKALEYLRHHDEAPVTRTDVHKIRWKIDRRLLPLLFLTYAFQFLDKVAFNVSTLTKQL